MERKTMLNHNNIDRQASADVSPAPFTYNSTMRIGDVVFPAGSFLTLKVNVGPNNLMPYRFHSVQPDGKVIICDRRGVLVGYWQLFSRTEANTNYVSSVLLDMQGALMGHIACTVQAVNLMSSIAANTLETIFLDADAFEFLPQCHIAMLDGFAKTIGIQSQNNNMEYHTGNLVIDMNNSEDSCVYMGINGDIPVNLTNTKTTLEGRSTRNGICSLLVNGATYSCAGHNIILKAAMASNLRVVMEDNKIVLRGVLNA